MNNLGNKRGFNIEAEERSASPEKLNECIRIGSKGGLLLITALVIAAVALIVWGFLGTIPVTVTELVGIVGNEKGTHLCLGFLDISNNTGIFDEGTPVNIRMPDGKSVKGTIDIMPSQPLSSEEIRALFGDDGKKLLYLSDWMMETLLGDSSYSFMFYIDTEDDVSDYWHQVAEATIITGEVKPISLLMR